MPQIGFIGLGDMGGPMATHLVESGMEVTVFDLDTERIEALADAGANPADSSFDAANGADVVFLSLPGPDAVNAVVDEIESALEADAILVDTTTSTPRTTERIAERLRDRDVSVLSAPISGGKSGSQAGTLSVMVGGERGLFEVCRPLFETFATDVFYLGDGPGDGHAAKLLNNYLSYTALLATSEAVVLGDIAGLDRELLLSVFNASTATNSSTADKLPNQVLTGEYDTGFPLELVEKDVRLFTQFSEEYETPMLVGNAVRALVGYARSQQGDDADMTRLYDFVEDMMSGD
jgi:3-hydroxyisobutyrate dehydrogenase-like beta-hydroxyacid dehydrogenase